MEPKKICFKNEVLAIFYSKKIDAGGSIKFLTPSDYPLQIGLIEYAEGKKVNPHIHRDLRYNVNTTQEFIYVEKGDGVLVSVYTKNWEEVERIIMSAGDFVLFVAGGHSLDIPKGCRILEVKQGPYPGDKEAKIFKD